jgi:membrane fusion protein
MSQLFRDEVIRAQQAAYLGTIRVGHSPAFALVTLVAGCLAVALVAYGYWGEVTRKARVSGVLMPALGSLQLSASTAGVLIESRVIEGEHVEGGQVLFVLRTDHGTTSGDTAVLIAKNLDQRRATLITERGLRVLQASQRQQALSDNIRNTEASMRQAQGEADVAASRVLLSTKSVERYRQLAKEGFVADIQWQQKQEDLLDLQARAQTSERTRLSLARELQSLKADLVTSATQLGTDLALIDRNLAALTQEGTENDARKHIVINAPQAGTVTGLTVNLGATLPAGQTIATLIPNASGGKSSELQALLFAPSRTAGFVRAGQSVFLRYAAYPYQKFGMSQGKVIAVSQTPINPNDLPVGQAQALLSAAQSNEPLYRIKVQLAQQTITTYGQVQELKPAMALDADIVQETRAVWEWMLEPVLAASGLSKTLNSVPTQPGV